MVSCFKGTGKICSGPRRFQRVSPLVNMADSRHINNDTGPTLQTQQRETAYRILIANELRSGSDCHGLVAEQNVRVRPPVN